MGKAFVTILKGVQSAASAIARWSKPTPSVYDVRKQLGMTYKELKESADKGKGWTDLL